MNKLIPMVDRFICPNNSQKALLKMVGIPDNKMVVLPYTSDFRPKDTVMPAGKYLGYAGGLIKEKGVHVLLRALSLLPEDIKLLIAGEGIFKEDLVKLSEKLGIDDRVYFMGKLSRKEMRDFYDKINILVVPSLWPEVFGIVGLEAMASGKPVIGSNIGGIPDWIDDGANGFLVPPNSPESIAEGVNVLYNTDGLMQEFGFSGRKRFIDKFSPEIHKREIIDLYRNILK